MRTIIRFSVDNEKTGALRNKLNGVLTSNGFVLTRRTATYEHANITQTTLSNVMSSFWGAAVTHKGTGRLDHFWMYSDTPHTVP